MDDQAHKSIAVGLALLESKLNKGEVDLLKSLLEVTYVHGKIAGTKETNHEVEAILRRGTDVVGPERTSDAKH